MDVAPWIANWIMMVFDGSAWYSMVFCTFAGKHKTQKISTHICRESEDSEVSSDSEDEWRELHNYSATPYWPDD